MHFGRVSSPDGIRFEPPPPDARTTRVLGGVRAEAATLRLGAPIWSVREWVGGIYPKGTQPRDFLRHYARRFPCVELNSTFYSLPPTARFEAWRDAVPAGFRFCPKIPRDASHARPGPARDAALDAFAQNVTALEDRLGPPFLQLPPEIGPDRIEQVRDLVGRLPRSLRPAIEFRHPDWFVERRLRGRAFDWMRDEQIPVVISDVAGRRDVLHGSLPTDRVVIRFGGNHLHPTDYERVLDWARRLATWFEQGLREAYLFIHQPEDVHSPPLLAALEDALADRAPELLPNPAPPLPSPGPADRQLRLL